MSHSTAPANHPETDSSINPLTVLRTALSIIVPIVILFGSAGTINWPVGWLYILVTFGGVILSRILAGRAHPDLLRERSESIHAVNVPGWDRILVPFVSTFIPVAILVVAGTDRRFAWSQIDSIVPAAAGLLVIAAALAFVTWAMTTNRYFSAYVRLQSDRGHVPVSRGPYSFIRHPGYLGGIFNNLGTPLILGSWWALVPAIIGIGIFLLRTALEDRWLRQNLSGYSEYARQVRWRLFPYVW